VTGARRGLVLGKFLPPHDGHLYLIDFARRWVDELTVVVGTLASEPIDGALRYRWVRELCPGARVVHLTDENPQHPDEHPDFWRIWRDSLLGVLSEKPDVVFASESYGPRLAEVLGAAFVPVDPARAARAVSGTAVRADPLAHWDHLPPCVRAHYALRVCIFGPESTGKTTLARQLAARLDTAWVPEYARTLLEAQGGAIALEDIERIARGQLASEDALARRANRVLVCDTDVLATAIWSDVLFGDCPAWIRAEADRRACDLYLVTGVDVPWEPDPVRYLPDQRAAFLTRCLAELERRGRRVVTLSGPPEARLRAAVAAVTALMDQRSPY
jgi:HTH-type transcriptional regulator, transcriptional repressor of NAD biosynthesis genes